MNTEFLALILGGGGVAMLGAIVQAYRSIKDGARIQEKDAFADLEAARRRENTNREWAEVERDYWRSYAANLEYFIRTNYGPDKVPARPPMPEKPKEEEE